MPSSRRRSLLLVEDDLELASLVRGALQEAGSEVAHAHSARFAHRLLHSRPWDLVVLDLQLPDGDGRELCSELRSCSSTMPVLMLTARASEADRITGLELGADDYLTKPFSLRELVLRVGNLLWRRSGVPPELPQASRVTCGDIVIETETRRVFLRGSEIPLTPREFDLLLHLARHPDRVFTRGQLLGAIWGARFEGFEHTVNSHINRLRAKLEADPRHPAHLVTVWGSGYRLVDSASTEPGAR